MDWAEKTWSFDERQVEAMHRIDEKLMKLDAHYEASDCPEDKQIILKEIKAPGIQSLKTVNKLTASWQQVMKNHEK